MSLKTRTGSKLHISVALVLAISLVCSSFVMADTKTTKKKTDAKKKEASVYSVKSNSINVELNGFKNKQDIVISFYEKQDNGKYKKIKSKKKSGVKGDVFKFKETLNEKSDFE